MESGPESALLESVEGTLIRGGTSKGLFMRHDDLPGSGAVRDELILELFGSPDPLQLNGIGGSKSHTSKLMLVSPSTADEYDVEYTFAQVGIEEPEVDWSKNCGNLTSAIGLFAVREGIVVPDEPTTDLRLYNTNTDTVIDQEVPIAQGEPDVYGDYSVDGVPGTGARIATQFHDPGGGVTGRLLPTGNAIDTLAVDGDEIEVSLVDATNLLLFVRASDLGLRGTELPDELAQETAIIDRLERLRANVRELLDMTEAKKSNPSIGIVSEPQSYDCSVDRSVSAADIAITSRFISLQPHHAIGMTGAMCLGAATRIQGTIPNEVAIPRDGSDVVIGHPKGTVAVDAAVSETSDSPQVDSITNYRTACPLFHGRIYYRTIGNLADV